MEEIFLAYGPLGAMVLGLGTAVIYLWRKLEEAHRAQTEIQRESHDAQLVLLKDSLENETEMNIKYLELCVQINRSLELLTEKIGNGTDFRVKAKS